MKYKVKSFIVCIRLEGEFTDIVYHTFGKVPKGDQVMKGKEDWVKDEQNCSPQREFKESTKDTIGNYTLLPSDTPTGRSKQTYNFFLTALKLDAHLASCLIFEFKLFPQFRERLFRFFKKNYNSQHTIVNFNEQDMEAHTTTIKEQNKYVIFDYVVEVYPVYPKQKVDYAWSYRLGAQMVRRMLLEEAFAWFSTLGGAYSSLGDCFPRFAEEAGRIAMKQLRIAEEEENPILECKAKLFFAQSLMQRGYTAESQRIIRAQTVFAKRMIEVDSKLLTMCHALRKRWKYVNNNKLTL
ncbi:uncharacterized protein LOC133201282 [Saccostrea echinata]|uniref:uncharacterized protein LOC133201282 n=1 Tax=Saccostrea echinata TaxID=191078 RepID=UPI002A825F8B|nr:uncharacterized protein LOC133201282 [Saccostrea echinata]